ncbi:MAG: hypothetical protein KDE51_18415, partial [Anaerolineales bacterium]|nr:hypothetical protein [Anaerolineales bacterium]
MPSPASVHSNSNRVTNSVLQAENQQLNDHLTAVHAVAQVVVNEPDLTALVHRLSEKIGQIMGADQVIIG